LNKPYRRTVDPHLTIMMSEPLANAGGDVVLRMPNGMDIPVPATGLNAEHGQQQADYAADAYVDDNGDLRGRGSGRLRHTNRIRRVYVGDLVLRVLAA
jgi:hypothetical protein